MRDPEWQGGKPDPRLSQTVRAEKQKSVQEKYERLRPYLDERGRRLWAAHEAIAFGHGGIRAGAAARRMSQGTLIAGRRELTGAASSGDRAPLPPGRPRRRRAG